ncbi:hypothetical protein O181_073653 [Austropuccinia psidii MF-1]|uniref:Uncharacterized protein n=1 Tax=Austropuccinia psidii MF-1 TaxID=1389203 RepID=A0A9Q3F9I3_9BASI|nr:hypothetical protein [Austropuccinia psidii MF-1]
MNTATLLSNLIPAPSRVNRSPYSLQANQSPQLRCLRTFGCTEFISTPKNNCMWKLGPERTEEILLGYEIKNTSYCILQISDAKIIITKYATVNVKKFPRLMGFVESSPLNLDYFTTMIDEADLVEKKKT